MPLAAVTFADFLPKRKDGFVFTHSAVNSHKMRKPYRSFSEAAKGVPLILWKQ